MTASELHLSSKAFGLSLERNTLLLQSFTTGSTRAPSKRFLGIQLQVHVLGKSFEGIENGTNSAGIIS